MKTEPIVVTQEFEVSVKALWKAITELEQMKQWFFPQIPAFKPEKGFTTSFMVKSGERDFLHQWEIIEVIPSEEIVYDWNYPDYPGQSFVIFELKNLSANTSKLTITSLGIETYPQEIPKFRPKSCRAGWEYFIQQNLKKYLND